MEITKRQKRILKAIINEYIKSARPVGSLLLYEKYNLGVSPATLRSEMAKLVKAGFLYKPHLSSGKIPTNVGLRFFLNEIIKEEKIDSIKETELKEKMFQTRYSKNEFLKEAVKTLAILCKNTSIAIADGLVFYHGLARLLENPEFSDNNLLQSTLDLIENQQILFSLFEKYCNGQDIKTLIGDEIGMRSLYRCSIVFSSFRYFGGGRGYISVLGPNRMSYSRVIPAVRLVSRFIEESIRGWD